MTIADIQARLLARGESAPAKLAAERQRNRELMPRSAELVDELTRVFGKLPYGRVAENDRVLTWGKKTW